MVAWQGRIQGGGGYFYSGFRKKIQVYTFIVASEKKTQGGVQFEILRNPGTCIDFDSGFRKKNPGTCIYFYGGFREKNHKGGGGGGAIRNPKKIR